MLQGDIEIGRNDGRVLRHGFEQPRGDLVGIGVEEAQPLEAGQHGEGVEQGSEAVGQAEILAVAGGVLADKGELANALRDQVLCLGEDGSQTTRAELAAQLRDDAEAAGVIAALGDLDVGRRSGCRQDARGCVRVEEVRQGGGGAVPALAREAACRLAGVAFGT